MSEVIWTEANEIIQKHRNEIDYSHGAVETLVSRWLNKTRGYIEVAANEIPLRPHKTNLRYGGRIDRMFRDKQRKYIGIEVEHQRTADRYRAIELNATARRSKCKLAIIVSTR